jgi:hypothetical protein
MPLGGSILGGVGSTQGIGERSPYFSAYGDLSAGPIGVEGYWSSADKVESPGWIAKALLKAGLGPVEAGIGRSFRHTDAWDKGGTWGHAGVKAGPFLLAVEKALGTPNDETKVEGRLRLRQKNGLTVEPRAFYERYRDSAGARHGGWGLETLLGYSWK